MIAGQAQGNKAPLGHDLSGGAFVFVQWSLPAADDIETDAPPHAGAANDNA